MTERGRIVQGLTETVEGLSRRFDVGLIEEVEESLCVTSRYCCLDHCPGPLILFFWQTGCFRARARK